MGLSSNLPFILRLGRLHMTQFSALTYITAAIVSCEITKNTLKWSPFLTGYAFVFACQMVAHFLGEYYDQASDRLNIHGSPLTGGSGVLQANAISPKIPLYVGWSFSAFCLILICFVLPSNATVIALAMFAIAHQYSAPPFVLNHNGLGEIAAATVQNILLPAFAAMCQSSQFHPLFDGHLKHLVWPSAFIKFALFIVLNLNDRRPDWLSDKTTLPILIGEDRAIILHTIFMASGYVFAWNIMPFSVMKLLTMASSPLAFWIVLQMWTNRPYRYDRILALSLVHCTLVMWSILVDSMMHHILRTGSVHWSFIIVAVLAYKFALSCKGFLALWKDVNLVTNETRPPVLICGGGIAGLVSAIVLHRLRIPCVIIEQRDEEHSLNGADLALWPSAVQTLRALGVRESFWNDSARCVNSVLMRQMENAKTIQVIDMNAVVDGTQEKFRLVSRQLLMTELKKLIPTQHQVSYNTKLVAVSHADASNQVTAHIESSDGKDTITRAIVCKLIIGADGVYSTVRRLTLPNCGISVRYCGEMCYRGVIDFNQSQDPQGRLLLPVFKNIVTDVPEDTMLITYGQGIRSSVGYLDEINKSRGYWWLKQISKQKEESPDTADWPVNLKTLYDQTPKECLYAHEIIDSRPASRRITSHCSVLIGDAAHPITPNMGQGACLAIEDAFVLCTNIGFYSDYVDGDTEACYQYEISRRNHTAAIARSSYIQSKVGQLSNPILVWMRNNILYNLPRRILINQLRSNNFDISHHLNLFVHQSALAEAC